MCSDLHLQETGMSAEAGKGSNQGVPVYSTTQMLNRRSFLRLGSLVGATMLAAGSLAACGSVPTITPEPAGTEQAADLLRYKVAQQGNGRPAPQITQPNTGPSIANSIFNTTPPPNLNDWLNQHQNVRDAIVWQDENIVIKYYVWPAPLKFRLQDIFDSIWTVKPVYPGNYSLPFNIMNLNDPTTAATLLTKSDALTGYLDYLAYSLRTELSKEVKWSMINYSPLELSNLLDSRTVYEWVTGPNATFAGPIPVGYNGGYKIKWTNLPTHPSFSLQFLKDNDLIGVSIYDTIGRVIYWCGMNFCHVGETSNTKKLSSGDFNNNIWHYRGAVPITRMITGTDPTDPILFLRHWTDGCWGTVGFMKLVLQILNIPIEHIYMQGHSLPHFLSEGVYMSHGDDPYEIIDRYPQVKGTDLLIYQASFNSHFGPGVSDANKLENVGFRPIELENQLNFTISNNLNLPPITKPPLPTIKI